MSQKKAEQIVERILMINREPEIHSNERERFRDMVEVIEEALMLPELIFAKIVDVRTELLMFECGNSIDVGEIIKDLNEILQLIKEARE